MRFMIGAAAAIVLVAGLGASRAEAAYCFWNGVAWECWHHPRYEAREYPPYWHSTPGWPGPLWHFYGWDRG